MDLPKKAVVLAAGLGTRLRPLTLVHPKPLLPVWGTSMLERAIRRLERWGVEEIAVNAHHLAPQIRMYAAGRKGLAKITVAEEPEILGTGGVLNPLRGWIGALMKFTNELPIFSPGSRKQEEPLCMVSAEKQRQAVIRMLRSTCPVITQS